MPLAEIEKDEVFDFNEFEEQQDWFGQAQENENLDSSSLSSSSNSDAGFNEHDDDYWPDYGQSMVEDDVDLWEAFDELPEVSNFVADEDVEIQEEMVLPEVDIDVNPVNIDTIAIPDHYFLRGSGKSPQIYLGPSTSDGQKLEMFEFYFEKLNGTYYEKDEDDLE